MPAFAKLVEGPILSSWPLDPSMGGTTPGGANAVDPVPGLPVAEGSFAPASACSMVKPGKSDPAGKLSPIELGVACCAVLALTIWRIKPNLCVQVLFGLTTAVFSSEKT